MRQAVRKGCSTQCAWNVYILRKGSHVIIRPRHVARLGRPLLSKGGTAGGTTAGSATTCIPLARQFRSSMPSNSNDAPTFQQKAGKNTLPCAGRPAGMHRPVRYGSCASSLSLHFFALPPHRGGSMWIKSGPSLKGEAQCRSEDPPSPSPAALRLAVQPIAAMERAAVDRGGQPNAAGWAAPPPCAPPLLGGPEQPFSVRVSRACTCSIIAAHSTRLAAGQRWSKAAAAPAAPTFKRAALSSSSHH